MSNNANDGSSVQNNNGYGVPPTQPPVCPKDRLIGNIVLTVLGTGSCIGLILGIIGIVFSTQVKSKYALGDYAGAESAANTAKILFIINLVLTILAAIGWIIYIIAFIAVIGSGALLSLY